MTTDPILRADRAEEIQARLALRSTRNNHELGVVWMLDCDHFTGDARIRLQAIFTKMLTKHGAFTP